MLNWFVQFVFVNLVLVNLTFKCLQHIHRCKYSFIWLSQIHFYIYLIHNYGCSLPSAKLKTIVCISQLWQQVTNNQTQMRGFLTHRKTKTTHKAVAKISSRFRINHGLSAIIPQAFTSWLKTHVKHTYYIQTYHVRRLYKFTYICIYICTYRH